MSIAFVLGNGVSRRDVSLTQLQSVGATYGCNAIYREFTPTVLVATDRPIASFIQQSGYPLTNKFYTRKKQVNPGSNAIPSEYTGFSSGPVAVALALLDGHKHIYMIGFDMGPNENKKINNLYAGTDFYKPVGSSPIYAGNWVKQIKTIANNFPQSDLIRVVGNCTALIPDFDTVRNIKHLNLDAFLQRINKPKDL